MDIAIKKELVIRHEELGGWIHYSPLASGSDTARFIKKTVQTVDTSFQVILDRYDPHSTDKLLQFLIKDELPVDIYKLDSLFKIELINEKYSNLDTYIDYIDLKTNRILTSSRSFDLSNSYLPSDIFPIDIFDSLGIKAYVENPIFSILGLMIFQLSLSLTLIIISIIFIFLLVKTIFWQRKEEKMRQDSINAMTHEFRRPISSAVTLTSLIPYYIQKNMNAKVEQYVSDIMLELNKLTVYIEKIQQLSNNSKDTVILNKKHIELKYFIEELLFKYTDSEEKKVKLTLEYFSNERHIFVDLLHFSNIMENLIENAIKYSTKEVFIEIIISDEKDMLKISIKDNGLGISKIDQIHIFEKYYRSKNNEVQRCVGFGLGLTYVKALVEAHGGSVFVNSVLGEGSEFVIYLPKQ